MFSRLTTFICKKGKLKQQYSVKNSKNQSNSLSVKENNLNKNNIVCTVTFLDDTEIKFNLNVII